MKGLRRYWNGHCIAQKPSIIGINSANKTLNQRFLSTLCKYGFKNYNDLCQRTTAPVILALLILPQNKEEWVKWSKDELMLKGKMFWLSLYGEQISDNVGFVSVSIPLSNVLNDKSIEMLLTKVASEGRI